MPLRQPKKTAVSEDKMKKILVFLAIGIPFAILYFFVLSGNLVCVLPDRYGREFNAERIRINQPVIEEFFVEVPTKDCQGRGWALSNELDTGIVHTSKYYYTNGFGSLLYETDHFRVKIDSNWIKMSLQRMRTDPPISSDPASYEFSRTYHSSSDSITYSLDYLFKGGVRFGSMLPFATGDSIYRVHVLERQ